MARGWSWSVGRVVLTCVPTEARRELLQRHAQHAQGDAMKALVSERPRKVRVKEVPDAKIERSTDAVVRIRSTNICGSDLHMYEDRTDMESGRVLGTRSSERWPR